MNKNTDVSRIALRRVLDVALLEFGSKGYELTNVDEIVKRSGVDKDFISQHFNGKNDLFIAVLRDICSHYLFGDKNYKDCEDFFLRSVRRIKEIAKTAQPILDFLICFSYTMNFLPKEFVEKIRKMVEPTDAYKILSARLLEKNIKDDAFVIITAFIRASSALTKIYANTGMDLPSDNTYLDPFKKYFSNSVRVNSNAYKDVGSSTIAEEVFKSDGVGTYLIEYNDGEAPKMYADKNCLQLLELEEFGSDPAKVYEQWLSRIDPESSESINTNVELLRKGQGVYKVEYLYIKLDGTKLYLKAAAKTIVNEKGSSKMEGIIKDATEEYNAREKVKTGAVLEEIASALAGQIEIIFYVDVENNNYLIYKPTKGLENFDLEYKGENFFIDAAGMIRKYIYKEDYIAFTAFIEKHNLLDKFPAKEPVILNFRISVNNKPIHTKMVVTQTKDKKHLILSIENVEHDYLINQLNKTKNNAILKNLTSNYDFITYVQLSKGEHPDKAKDSPYSVTETFSEIMPNLLKTKYFSDKLDEITISVVSPKEQSQFRKAVSFNEVIEALSYEPEYVVPFRANIGGEEIFYQAKFTADKQSNNDINGIIVSFGSIDKDIKIKNKVEELETEQRKIQSFNKLFADIYYSAYLLDLEENSFAIYKRHNEYADGFIELENFDDYFEDFIEEEVFEPDRDMMLEVLKTDYIRGKLKETDEFQIKYRDISMGSVLWFRLVIVKGEDENSAAIGVVNIDNEVKKTQNEQEKLEHLVSERTKELNKINEELQATNEGIFEVLSETVEGRDKESGEHVKRVSTYTRILAQEVKKECPEYKLTDEYIEDITLASKLHDIGKIAISDSILLKPGKLTTEEFEKMKTHTTEGAKLLSKLTDIWKGRYLQIAIEICQNHHEKWDGKGYPRGLKGDQIPISAQIVSIADCFDALTNERVYKPAYSAEDAFNMILNGECGAYSQKLLKCFQAVKEKFFDCRNNVSKYAKETKHHVTNMKEVKFEPEAKAIDPAHGLDYDMLERILKELPSNIFFKDTKGRYVFCSQIWKQIKTDGSENFSIRGKTDLECRIDRDNAKKAVNEDRKIVKTGRPSHYVIKANMDPTKPEYIELIKRPVRDKNGKIIGIVGQINDVTEKIAIEEKLRKVAETDELTGFGNRAKLDEYIKSTLPNVLYPVGVFMADCDRLKHVNDTFGHKAGDRFIKATAGILTTSFPDNSEFFRLGGDEFLIIVPGSDQGDCEKYMEEIKAQSNLVIEDTRVSVSVGSAIMEWPDEPFEKVYEKADRMMYIEKNVKHAEQAALEKKLAEGKKNKKA